MPVARNRTASRNSTGSVDVIVIGRKTFEVVLDFGQWAYGKKQVVVLSSGPLDFSPVKGGVVEQMSGEPLEIAKQLKARGFKHASTACVFSSKLIELKTAKAKTTGHFVYEMCKGLLKLKRK
jgi:dihydrofolate reductase